MSTEITGHCYCGDVHWKAQGPGFMKFECYCRECRYHSGGGPVIGFAVMNEGFEITKGAVKGFTRSDIDGAVTRQFCPNCGTHMFTRAPSFPQGLIVKAGSLDNEADFDGPEFAAFTCDARPWHRLPDTLPVHERWPG
ncbi:MAG: GFA family protein [Sphingomonadales bacterium]|nr:GFA family protein [Sphingomonadales bacterium]